MSKKSNEAVMLLKGAGSIIVKEGEKESAIRLKKGAVAFIPKGTEFCFSPSPSMEILSATGPAWYPKQQAGLDYRRKNGGKMIL